MTRAEMLREFDRANAHPYRRKHIDADLVKRLRVRHVGGVGAVAITDGLVDYDPIEQRLEVTDKAKARGASVGFHFEGGTA
jgi:hypothetical protein